jgi:YHYH protein
MKTNLSLRARVVSASAVVAALALAACGGAAVSDSTATTASTTTATTAATTSSSTKAGLKKTKWGKNMTVSYGTSTIRLRSDGIPTQARPKYYAELGAITAANSEVAADPINEQSYDYKITTNPKKSSKTTDAPLGSIGMMISGAVLFNPYEADSTTVAQASNFSLTAPDGSVASFIDTCNGHSTPAMGNGGGQYHYHALPVCVSKTVDTSTGPSHILGVAFDGFPIYGKRDIKGKVVPVSKLDKCNGITSATPEFPKGIYHYVLPGTNNATSSIRCFRGKVDSSLITQMPNMGGGPPGGGPPPATARAASAAVRLLCDLTGVGL